MRHLFLLLVLLLTACGGKAVLNQTLTHPSGVEGNFEELPDQDITKFDIRVPVEVPAWKLWNVFFTDTHRLAEITGNQVEALEMRFTGPKEAVFTWAVKHSWWLPRAEITSRWIIDPENFTVDQTCVKGFATECMIRISFTPMEGGKHAMVRYQGYMGRPWYVSHAQLSGNMMKTFSGSSGRIKIISLEPKYQNQNVNLPWNEINQFAVTSAPAQVTASGLKPRVLIQDFVITAANTTDTTVIRLASSYLAESLSRGGKVDVITDWDVQLMAKYLKADWELRCGQDTKCTERMLEMVRARYVMAGEVARTDDRYVITLMLMDTSKFQPAWRLHREVAATSAELRTVIQEAAEQLRSASL